MRLATMTSHGESRVVGVSLEAGETRFVDLRAADADLPKTLITLLAREDGLSRAAAALQRGLVEERFLTGTLDAPIPNPGKVICIGLNYRDHAAESGMAVPSEPVCFSKFSSAVIGPNTDIELPPAAKQVDYEAELVAVIGRRGIRIAESDARTYVAGYMNGNDVSVRDWQFHSPTWMTGKGFDTHGPIGPWLVTRDEVDPSVLDVRTFVNDELKQESNTNQLIFDVGDIIEYLSAACTLEPGDVIFTGTPAGVGVAHRPPQFLKAGDTVRVEIAGLGSLENPVIAEPRGE